MPRLQTFSAVLVLSLASLMGCDSNTGTENTARTGDTAVRSGPANPYTGNHLSLGCVECHGDKGISNQEGVPHIAGLNQTYLRDALIAYREGERKHIKMRMLVAGLSDKALTDIAAYYSDQTPAGKLQRSKGEEARQRQYFADIVNGCSSCHGAQGHSVSPGTPHLAGLSAEYFTSAMQSYASGERHHPMMTMLASTLNDDIVLSLAQWYSERPTAQPVHRSLVSQPGDPVEGRQLAAACVECHSDSGTQRDPKTPHLAAQDQLYLTLAMQAYADGRRQHATMAEALRALHPDQIQDLASYYASLRPSHGNTNASAANHHPVQEEPVAIAAGREAAASCSECHGVNGNSILAGVPSLTGQHPDFLMEAMRSFRNGDRKQNRMEDCLRSLNRKEMRNIALFYAVQQPAMASSQGRDLGSVEDTDLVPANYVTTSIKSGNALKGQQATAQCMGCHGRDGNSHKPKVPSLAGQDPTYLIKSLEDIKADRRDHPLASDGTVTADNLFESLSAKSIKNIAAFYAAIEPKKAQRVPTPLTLNQWRGKCELCHGQDGSGLGNAAPRIAGQRQEYLEHVLTEYRNKQRGQQNRAQMHVMTHDMSQVEIEALAQHYSNL